MTQFLPYAIFAGVIVVFFALCYIMYSGTSSESSEAPSSKKKKKKNQEMQKNHGERHVVMSGSSHSQHNGLAHTMPVPKVSNVTLRERQENPKETQFVTTKGEIVRSDGKMFYKKASKGQPADANFEATRVISRSEVLAAMKEVDKQEVDTKENMHEEPKTAKAPLAEMTSVIAADLKEKNKGPVVPPAQEKRRTADPLSDETIVLKPQDLKNKMNPVHVDAAKVDTETSKKEMPETNKRRQSPWGNDITADAHGVKQKSMESIWNQPSSVDSPVVKKCVSHFLDHYGIVTPEAAGQVQFITEEAFRRIDCHTETEQERAIKPFIIQEALQDVQKTYSAQPEDYVASVALSAFFDVVHWPQTSTRHLVAVNTLKIMPYLCREHYHILAILLVFLYSRNSHNVDAETFRQYIEKYVLPFLDHFPTERAYYQQLDYLRCTALESKETHFSDLLSDSYPLLFRYQGFTSEELTRSLRGNRIPQEFVVASFNSRLYKLALIDENMSPRFFRQINIADRTIQDSLLRLAKKRPASFRGEEALDILEDISPVFADIGDLWDSTLLRVSTLSLLGLYLAQSYVKETIGEEFDLSRWFE